MKSWMITISRLRPAFLTAVVAAATLLAATGAAQAQRLLGIDVSAWQGNLSQANWNTLLNTNDRDFVFIRASRGGSTGFDHNHDGLLTTNANCNGVSTDACLGRRYDDPYFGQNITRATNAGLFAGTYHRSRADVISTTPDTGGIANSGTDEANHMMQMAGAWMRPGYLPPVLDFEDGDGARTDIEMTQFALDFSNRIYAVMGIRPAIYSNGNYAQNILAGGTPAQRAELAQQSANPPSVISPAYSTLWSARWPNQQNPNAIDVQNLNPTEGFANIYGPWDDYGVTHPWSFWQYASTARLSGYNNGNSNIDVNVSKGDIEFVKDQLIPALWWTNTSGDWSTLANWNSGQTVVAPPVVPNMSPVQGSTTLPVARLPGAAGSGPTAGQNDTVILERSNANITVTLSSGSHNIRKLYMRETLDITGGSLNINYDPNYAVPLNGLGDPLYPNAVRSGPLSARFSGAVSLGGTGSLSVHTLQVDAAQTFTLSGGTLALHTISLMPHGTTPARIVINGDVNINPLANAAATIVNGGAGNSGLIDLGGASRVLSIADGSAATDLTISVPVTNGGLTKSGPGTLALTGANTYSGDTAVQAGALNIGSAFLADAADLYLTTGAALGLNFAGGPDVIDSLFFDGVSQAAGTWGAVGSAAQFESPLITGAGLLQVTTFLAPALSGDYNEDGVVDAADYVVWRHNENTTNALPNDNNIGGTIGQAHYDLWRANFGNSTPGSGSVVGTATVPEPGTLVLLAVAFGLVRPMVRRAKR